MPRGPRGEKRPADVIGNAVKVMRIATGEETEEVDPVKSAAAELGARAAGGSTVGRSLGWVNGFSSRPKGALFSAVSPLGNPAEKLEPFSRFVGLVR